MKTISVVETKGHSRIDRESGSLDMFRVFTVQRTGHDAHRVTVRVTESGTPQHETCDCQGFRFRGECSHVAAVYDAKLLSCYVD